MIKTNLILAIRNLRKHPTYAIINIVGLSIGLACCCFIAVYILSETSYDDFHSRKDRIFRVVENRSLDGRLSKRATSFGSLAPALSATFPVVENTARIYPLSLLVITADNQKYQEDEVLFVDSTFFDVFSFELKKGESSTVLAEPYNVVLTESSARKYFGSSDPVGETLTVQDQEVVHEAVVTGIVADPPPNSHIQFEILVSFSTVRIFMGGWIDDPRNWEYPPLYTYILLSSPEAATGLASALPRFAEDVMGTRRASTRSFHLQPLVDIWLRSNRESELTPVGDIAYVYVFGLICTLILIIVCANFVNLAMAKASERLKEMGVRRSMGALRPQLVVQLLGESFMQVGAALILALVLVETGLPLLGSSGYTVASVVAAAGKLPWLLAGIIVAVTLLAGLYPALYITSSSPSDALRSKGMAGIVSTALLRKGLVIGQFVISVGLILATIIVRGQLNFIQNEKLGFDKENAILIPLRDEEDQINNAALKESIERISGVISVSASSGMPGLDGGIHDFMIFPENSPDDSLEMLTLTVDHDYVRTYGLNIVEGRDFSEDVVSDIDAGFLINESAADKLGWRDPVGKDLTLKVWLSREVEKKGKVIGVVEDFQYNSLRLTISPIIMHIFPKTYYNDFLSVRLASGAGDFRPGIAAIEKQWSSFNPDRPFEFSFLDESFDALYAAGARLSDFFGIFAILAIVIACLGLFGLAAFSAEKRTKEIGIRKVLGASAVNIVALLGGDLLKPVAIAFCIGSTVAYFALQPWLESFAYRIYPGPEQFVATGIITLMIGLLAVAAQGYRAATADPVQSLRNE